MLEMTSGKGEAWSEVWLVWLWRMGIRRLWSSLVDA